MTTTTDTAESPAPWSLNPAEFTATKDKLEKINSRAIKRGFTGRIDITGTERTVTETTPLGEEYAHVVIDTTITGQAPSYDGWEFLAAVDTVETEEGTEFIVRTAPGVDEVDIDRSTLIPGYCAHCNLTRINRVYTYLVRNTETYEALQVGKTCMKDFTGWNTLPVFISEDDIHNELDDFLGGLPNSPAEYTPETIIAIAWPASRIYGWTPRYAAGIATSDRVSSYLYGTTKANNELRAEIAPEMPAATDKAREIIPALLEGLEDTSEYATNLKIALRGHSVSGKHLGIVTSAVIAYERMNETQIREKNEAENGKTETAYIGGKGDKITITGTVTKALAIENTFGYHTETSILLIVEDGPTILKTFTKAAWVFDIDQGDIVTFTATVKDHEEYQSAKQTVVNRPKLIKKHTIEEGEATK